MSKKVLIIGSTGYLGSYLEEELSKKGHNVINVNRRDASLHNKNFVIQDITNQKGFFESLIYEEKVDVIINLAWVGSYGDARFDIDTQLSNLKLNDYLVSISNKYNIHLISTGTISEYITNELGDPVSEYGIAKRKAHDLFDFANEYGKGKFTWLVLGNIFGGEDKTNRFVVTMTTKLLNNENLEIGTNGNQLFYSGHRTHLLEMIHSVITNEKTGSLLVSEQSTSLKDFLLTLKEEINSKSTISFGDKVETVPDVDFLRDKSSNAVKTNYDSSIAGLLLLIEDTKKMID